MTSELIVTRGRVAELVDQVVARMRDAGVPPDTVLLFRVYATGVSVGVIQSASDLVARLLDRGAHRTDDRAPSFDRVLHDMIFALGDLLTTLHQSQPQPDQPQPDQPQQPQQPQQQPPPRRSARLAVRNF